MEGLPEGTAGRGVGGGGKAGNYVVPSPQQRDAPGEIGSSWICCCFLRIPQELDRKVLRPLDSWARSGEHSSLSDHAVWEVKHGFRGTETGASQAWM